MALNIQLTMQHPILNMDIGNVTYIGAFFFLAKSTRVGEGSATCKNFLVAPQAQFFELKIQ